VLFSAHMVQHLLLIMVAPPLLILGRPVTLLLRVKRGRARTRVRGVIRSPAVSFLTWPPVSVTLYAAVVIATHLTPLMNLVLENAAIHDAEHALYFVAGYLYFLPIVGSEPIRWRTSVLGRYLLLLLTCRSTRLSAWSSCWRRTSCSRPTPGPAGPGVRVCSPICTTAA
jgi:cytochrome c oxidase assembly factor CtaG